MPADHLSPLTWQWRSQGAERQRKPGCLAGLFANAVTTFAVVMDTSQGENGRSFNMLDDTGNPGAGTPPSRR